MSNHIKMTSFICQMLREGKSNPNQAWPKVVHANSSGGQHQVTRSRRGPDGSDDSENEDHVPVPRYGETFGDAIQAALDKAVTKKTGGKIMIFTSKTWHILENRFLDRG